MPDDGCTLVRPGLVPRVAVVLAVVAAGCGRHAASKAQLLEAGDQYASDRKYTEAILSYRNAIKIDDRRGHHGRGPSRAR